MFPFVGPTRRQRLSIKKACPRGQGSLNGFGIEHALAYKGDSDMTATTKDVPEALFISEVKVPDSKLALEATELVRDTESSLLFNHSTRVYYFGSLAGKRWGLRFDPEQLYVAAMFHDMGLTSRYRSQSDRFEVDGANSARAFLRRHNISEQNIDTVWTAIALHTTPGIPQHMHPVVALLTNGVEMDVLGIAYSEFSDADREAIIAGYPRTEHFKEDIIQAFYDGIKHKPLTTFGNVKADVLADKDPNFQCMNFCSVIRRSQWKG
jgi:HD domain